MGWAAGIGATRGSGPLAARLALTRSVTLSQLLQELLQLLQLLTRVATAPIALTRAVTALFLLLPPTLLLLLLPTLLSAVPADSSLLISFFSTEIGHDFYFSHERVTIFSLFKLVTIH